MALSMTRYNPTARASSAATVSPGRRTAGQYPGGGNNHQYDNHDGPVRPGGDPRGDTIDYGPSNGPSQQERIDAAWKKWGGSGLYVNGVEMPWAHGPNQERGKRAPFFTPDVLDPRNAGYFAGGTTPEQDAARAAIYYGQEAAAHEGYMGNSTYANAYNSLVGHGYDPNQRDVKQQMRMAGVKSGKYDDPEMLAALKEWERAKRVAQFGLPADWTPPSKKGPWPAPHAPQSQGGGAPPATVQGGGVRRGATPSSGQMNGDAVQAFGKYGPPPQAMPPMQNPMMQGYQSAYPQGGYMGGGAGVPTGSGWGSAGGMPGVPSGGGWGSAGGNPMVSGGADLNRWLAMQGGGNPGASMGGGEMGYMYGNSPMGGGAGLDRNMMISQQYNQGGSPWASMFSRMGGGVPGGGNMSMMGGVPEGFMRFGGYRPAATQSMMYPY